MATSVLGLKGSHFPLTSSNKSLLSGLKFIETPSIRRPINSNKKITVVNAYGNNLQNITVDFPLGVLTCVTGVSGGGK